MSIEQIGIVAVAAVVAAWPHVRGAIGSIAGLLRPAVPAPGVPAVGYEAAIHDLAVVRSRLVATGLLADDAKKAIDTLTLALVAGSDK